MSRLVPTSKPQAKLADLHQILEDVAPKLKSTDKVILVGWRAYYRDTVGRKGKNDYGVYDDALFWVSPDSFSAWNANMDPSRTGFNPGVGKKYARLQDGVWRFVKWKHKGQYWAFGQGGNPVTVDRVNDDGSAAYSEKGCYGINIHRGGDNTTSSWGCQTLPPEQWEAFKAIGYALLDQYGQKDFPYVVVTNKDE